MNDRPVCLDGIYFNAKHVAAVKPHTDARNVPVHGYTKLWVVGDSEGFTIAMPTEAVVKAVWGTDP